MIDTKNFFGNQSRIGDIVMENFNYFYFLHIPKTGGHYIENNVIAPIQGFLSLKKIELVRGHKYWFPVTKGTYVMTSLRDPVERTVSMFVHRSKNNNNDNDVINVEKFLTWVENNKKYLSNFQAKSFLYKEPPDIDWYLFDSEIFINLNIDEELLNKKINRVNTFIDLSKINDDNIDKLKLKIVSDLGYQINESNIKKTSSKILNRTNNVDNDSKTLYNKLGKNEIEYIESINKIDMNLYHSDIYWDSKNKGAQ